MTEFDRNSLLEVLDASMRITTLIEPEHYYFEPAKTSGWPGRHISRRNLLRMDGEDRGRVDAEAEFVVDRRNRLPSNHDLEGDIAR